MNNILEEGQASTRKKKGATQKRNTTEWWSAVNRAAARFERAIPTVYRRYKERGEARVGWVGETGSLKASRKTC